MGEPQDRPAPENTYSLRPAFQHKFRSSAVKECIHAILKENLANVQYNPEETPELTRSLSETIKDRLKAEGFHRYKMVVQVVIGEQRGEGVKCTVLMALSRYICLAWLHDVSGMLTLTTMHRMFL
nr:dynein light chain Tctex-type protein 2B isoform X3 [Chrysemys picta bellii]